MQRKKPVGDLFLDLRWYLLAGCCSLLFFLSFFLPFLLVVASAAATLLLIFTLADYAILFLGKGQLAAKRAAAPRLSLGDENPVTILLSSSYAFKTHAEVIDELPFQLQERKFKRSAKLAPRGDARIVYTIRPGNRGEYQFGHVIVFASSALGLVIRRFTTGEEAVHKVYPGFMQLRKYQLMATTEQAMPGSRKMRRLGQSMEFEKIKEYVQGDDVRSINWKATARKGAVMVNTFTDARQQQIYCIVDKGRNMKMPFEGLTLLDYAINASLAILNVALLRQDKAGLVTFAEKVNTIVPADRRSGQSAHLLEALYKQETNFMESSYEALWSTVHRSINQRSLLLLFTNFETMSAVQRQLPYLRRMASRHLVCVVFFQNTLLKSIYETQPDSIEGIYIKTIADRFQYEKRQIVKELRRHGILSILSTPQQLSVNVINKYLELKSQQMI